MSEKYKVLRSAEKYVVTGKFPQAVKEYQKLLAKEPDEPTLLNTVGDLLLKQNNRDEALNYFRRAAEVYLRNGFLLKSIAVYKKIYQFSPTDNNVNESLADLYQRQGLVYEASRHLKILIHQHSESGNVDQASLYLQRLAQLSPNSPETQVELAELLQKRHDEAGAFEHYQAAAALYLQVDCPTQAFEAAQKALEIDPTDDRTVELYVSGGLKSGNKQVVRKTLKELIEKTGQRLPYEIFLAQILEEEGNRSAAHAKYVELEPLAYTDSRIREGLSRTLTRPPAEETPAPQGAEGEFTFDEPRTRIREARTPRSDWAHPGERFEEQHDPLFDAQRSALAGDSAFPSASQSSGLFTPPAAAAPPSEFPWQAQAPAAEEEEEEPFEGVAEDETPVEVEVTPIESLDEALQEADFYLKLGFREEAKKLLERLLHTYPRDERVRRRAEKVMTIPPEFDVAAQPAQLFPAEEAEAQAPPKRGARPKASERAEAPPPIHTLRPEPSEVGDSAVLADFLGPQHGEPEELPMEALFGTAPVAEVPKEEPVAAPAEEQKTDLFGSLDLSWDQEEPAVSTFDLDLETGDLSVESPAPSDISPATPVAQTGEQAAPPVFGAIDQPPVLDLDFLKAETPLESVFEEELRRAEGAEVLHLELQAVEPPVSEPAVEAASAQLEELEEAALLELDLPAAEAAISEPTVEAELPALEEAEVLELDLPAAEAAISEPTVEPEFPALEEAEVLELDLLPAAEAALSEPTVEAELPALEEAEVLELDLQPVEPAAEEEVGEETALPQEPSAVEPAPVDEAELGQMPVLDLGPAESAEAEIRPENQEAELVRLAELDAAAAHLGTLDLGGFAPVQTADLIPLEELDEAPVARPQITEPEFDEEIDSALDGLFSGEPLEEAPQEVLRYDVAATGSSDEATNPKVHYDLGLAYKEMGLVEDAVQEFQTAAQLLNSPIYNPQRILCCSMLANSLLQLGHFGEAHRWAEEGLRIPGKKEFEWKALKYDSSSALEKQGNYPEALEGFREILDRDPEYRDVLTRIDNLLRTQ